MSPLEDHNAAGEAVLPSAGSAYIFERNASGTWAQVQKMVRSDRESSDHFGLSVALSGSYALVGAPLENHNAVGGANQNNAG